MATASYSLFIDPCIVTTDREPGTNTKPEPITPTMDGDPLDNDPPPVLTVPLSSEGSIYAEHNFLSNGALDTVEIKYAAVMPTNPAAAIDSTEYLEIATIDTNDDPPTIIQIVEGNYYWPSKYAASSDPGTGANYIPPFHPIMDDNGTECTIHPGVCWITPFESSSPESAAQDPDTLWKVSEPVLKGVGGLARGLADPLSKLDVTPNTLNAYWARIQYTEEQFLMDGGGGADVNAIFYMDGLGSQSSDSPLQLFYRIDDSANPIEIEKGPNGGAKPAGHTLTLKFIPIATIDTRGAAPVITSYPHGVIDTRRHWILGHSGTASYTPTT